MTQSPLILALYALTAVMVVRQLVLFAQYHAVLVHYGRVHIRTSWWLHLFATMILVASSAYQAVAA